VRASEVVARTLTHAAALVATAVATAALASCTVVTTEPRVARASQVTEREPRGDGSVIGPLVDPPPVKGLESLPLEGREKGMFAEVVSQLYAPCTAHAVTLRQCVEEQRDCPACTPAARLLAEKIHEGATTAQAREIYAARFGGEAKAITVGESPARGPERAAVTIVVWSDFECPHCKHALPMLEKVAAKYASDVRLVHKFYPLRQHSHAAAAARAAIAAQNQGHYWEMERTLFDHQDEQTDTDLAKYAKDLHLDMKRYQADLEADRTTRLLERDHDEAERAGLTGTPFILINGREFNGSYFHVEGDLDGWVALEIELAKKR
jgi:protein-disulfide isomerase